MRPVSAVDSEWLKRSLTSSSPSFAHNVIGRICSPVDTIDVVRLFSMSWSSLPKPQQLARLNLKQTGLDGGGTPQPQQEARQSKGELPFNGRWRVVVGGYRHFKRHIILGVFQRRDDGLRR
jgi:hypothetical protein